MRNHLLEEAYQTLQEPDLVIESELLEEAPTPEQDWLAKNVINHLQKAMEGLNVARSHIPIFISRREVRNEVDAIRAIHGRMLEKWHDIQDVVGNKPQAAIKEETAEESDNWYAPSEGEATQRAQTLMKKYKRNSCYVSPVTTGAHADEWVITPDKRSEASKLVTLS